MQTDSHTAEARDLMIAFADRSGLGNTDVTPRRYLWTDAHAVCNFLSLYRRTQDERWKLLALELVEQVHHVLGKHRDDDPRSGWISGLDEADGEEHPTAGGLRIGKKLNERGQGEAHNERLEWDRDGQYFHYLTKWMHALCRVGSVTADARYCRWAAELARAAHAGFLRSSPAGVRRLVWKMSIDLTYPLVATAGLHDALDGFVTYHEIRHCADGVHRAAPQPDLQAETIQAAAMLGANSFATSDPLGIGGLLFDACRVSQLTADGDANGRELLDRLLADAIDGLDGDQITATLSYPADYRLAFRELGLAIGLHAVERMQRLYAAGALIPPVSVRRRLALLAARSALGTAIETHWRDPHSHESASWRDHEDINDVMLATSLLPDEFLAVG